MKKIRRTYRWVSWTWKTEAQIENSITTLERLWFDCDTNSKMEDALSTALMLLRHATKDERFKEGESI